MPLGACGAHTDDFTTFPSAAWQTHGTMSNPSNQAKTQVNNFDSFAGAWLQASTFDECAETIDLGNQPNQGGVYLNIRQNGFNNVEIDYYDTTMTIVSGANTLNVTAKPQSLGIALTGGVVYLVYRDTNAWHVLDHFTRPGWMNNGFGAALGFGIASSSGGKSATFDNYNLPPISPQDLGL